MADFDSAAKEYDQTFTHSPIGILQRNSVWQYMEETLEFKGKKILELNCGTGEDALKFAERGARVVATDISTKMISVAQQKAAKHKLTNCEFFSLDVNNLSELPEDKFDIIFSNFGGLNCLPPEQLKLLFQNMSKLLKPNGRNIMVIMPKYCLWEICYLLLKGNKQLFRRSINEPALVNVEGNTVKTWYYAPNEINNLATQYFQKINQTPIGLFVPPSYMNQYFDSKPKFLKRLGKLDSRIRMSWTASFSDHFLIDFKKL